LLTFAFETFAKNSKLVGSERTIKALIDLAKASGTYGMVGGQVVDMESENKKVGFKTIEYIHNHKTSALICSSIRVGAILLGAKDKELSALTKYGKNIGDRFDSDLEKIMLTCLERSVETFDLTKVSHSNYEKDSRRASFYTVYHPSFCFL